MRIRTARGIITITPTRTRTSRGPAVTTTRTETMSAPHRIDKPWGYELLWARTDRYVGKILHIARGEALSLQYHRAKDETIMVLSGRIALDYFRDGETAQRVVLEPRHPFHIPPGMRHRMTALEDADVVEVSTPELDDVVRLEDRYGRAG
jgi:mannose-6-phosphate isomerase-like protein (cupin superfamily)